MVSHDLFKRLARFVVAATTVATAALCVVPLFAVVTGAYPLDVAAISRLLLLLLPQAVAVAPPAAAATAAFGSAAVPPAASQADVAAGDFHVGEGAAVFVDAEITGR